MPTTMNLAVNSQNESTSRANWRGYAISATLHAVLMLALAFVVLGESGVETFIVTAKQATARAEPLIAIPLEPAPAPEPQTSEAIELASPLPKLSLAPIPVDLPGRLASQRLGALSGSGQNVVTVAHAQPVTKTETKPKEKDADAVPSDSRRATFFGSHAYGNNFVFILDASPSMVGARYRRACDELIASLMKLEDSQSFYVLLFSWRTQLMFDGPLASIQFIPATDENVDRFRQWLYAQDVRKNNGTDPRVALDLAERLQPDAVFLLSDGEFNKPPRWNPSMPTRAMPQHSVARLVEMIYETIPLHCIAFEIAACEPGLRALSVLTGGSCRFVPPLRPDADQIFLTKLENQLRQVDPKGTGDSFRAQQTRLTIANWLVEKGFAEEAQDVIEVLADKQLPSRLQRKLESIQGKISE